MWPNSTERIKKIWKDHTFSLSEIFSDVYLPSNNKNDVNCNVHIQNKINKYTCGDFTIEIKPISTVYYGICYSMQVLENINADGFLIIQFLKSNSGKVCLVEILIFLTIALN